MLRSLLPLALLALHPLSGCSPSPADANDATTGGGGLAIREPGDRPYYFDFGEVPWGERKSHTFHLENTDSTPLTVLSAQGACSCTSLSSFQYTDPDSGELVRGKLRATEGVLTIPPGVTAEMTIRVDTTKLKQTRKTEKLSIMRLRTDSIATPFLTFETRVIAVHLFQATPSEFRMSEVPKSHGGTLKSTIITSAPDSKARILGIASPGRVITAELEESHQFGKDVWTLTVTIPANQEIGPLVDEVVLQTTNSAGAGDGGRVTFDVRAQIVEDVIVSPRVFNISTLAAAEPGRVEARLKALVPGMRVQILGAEVEGAGSGHLTAAYDPLDPDATGHSSQWNLALESAGGIPVGRLDGTLVVHLDDENMPELRVPIRGAVQ